MLSLLLAGIQLAIFALVLMGVISDTEFFISTLFVAIVMVCLRMIRKSKAMANDNPTHRTQPDFDDDGYLSYDD